MRNEKIGYNSKHVEVHIMPKGKRHSAQFKFKVALEAAKEIKTLGQLASECGLHPSQVSAWKHRLLDEGASIFSASSARQQQEQEALQAQLYEQIGRLKMELEWLKKKSCRMTCGPSGPWWSLVTPS